VTGAAGALGRQMALTLAQAGAHVVLAGRTLETLQATAEAVTAQGGTAHCVCMDVSVESSIVSALDEARERAGIISIVINNAGTNCPKPALEVTAGDWDRVLGTNLRGCFLVARECARRSMQRGLAPSSTSPQCWHCVGRRASVPTWRPKPGSCILPDPSRWNGRYTGFGSMPCCRGT